MIIVCDAIYHQWLHLILEAVFIYVLVHYKDHRFLMISCGFLVFSCYAPCMRGLGTLLIHILSALRHNVMMRSIFIYGAHIRSQTGHIIHFIPFSFANLYTNQESLTLNHIFSTTIRNVYFLVESTTSSLSMAPIGQNLNISWIIDS